MLAIERIEAMDYTITSQTSLIGWDMKNWPLQDAKAQLSQVVRSATAEGPQQITVRGQPAVVVISKETYDRLVQPKPSFVEFLRRSPLKGSGLKIVRDRSLNRDIDL